jgi:hypothetical protein
METFTHDGQRCLSVNGKDFFLIRGYTKNHQKFIFIQVAGNTPLNKEDLPSKSWEVIRTRAGKERVWMAYQKNYFQYETQRSDPALAFVGASTEGSFFLALKQIVRRFNLGYGDNRIHELALKHASGQISHWRLERLHDQGNTGVDAVLMDFSGFDVEEAEAFFRGG